MSCLVLRNTQYAAGTTSAWGLVCLGYAPVIKCLLDEQDGENQGDCGLRYVDPEGDWPWLRSRHESREERSEIGADDKKGPGSK